MNTVAVGDDTDEQIEELQEMLPWSPSKKDIVAKAVENFHDLKSEEHGDSIEEENNDTQSTQET